MPSSDNLATLERLKEAFQKLPGIGARSAERLAFHLLREPRKEAEGLSAAILAIKDSIFHCSVCYNLTEHDPCPICTNAGRDQGEIWVVEQSKDVIALEATGLVRGVYHVLMGHIAPLEGIEASDLTITSLIERVKKGTVREIVLATNPTIEGDGTALHIQSTLMEMGVTITRPSRGLAVGSPLEYASPAMLETAIRGRSEM